MNTIQPNLTTQVETHTKKKYFKPIKKSYKTHNPLTDTSTNNHYPETNHHPIPGTAPRPLIQYLNSESSGVLHRRPTPTNQHPSKREPNKEHDRMSHP